jgi:hypothetical protein
MVERLSVAPEDWEAIEAGARQGHHPRTVMVEWWRLALGMSVEEFEAMPEGGVKVTEYEVTAEDGERLLSILKQCKSEKVAMMTWLDLGPRVAD